MTEWMKAVGLEAVPLALLPWIGLSLLIALLLGLIIGRTGRAKLHRQAEQAERQRERAEADSKNQHRTLARMRSELDTVASLARTLPHVVRDLNRDDIHPRDVPASILKMAHAIFEPEQILLYGLRSAAGGGSGKPELQLVAHDGLSPVPDAVRTVALGSGKLGWVAEHELDMQLEDWEKIARAEGQRIPANHALLKMDLVGPLVHHASEASTVLGVLSIGGLRRRPRDEKLMFQLVTNLGSLALVNAHNLTQMRSMAHHDGLTGLLNKRYFIGTLLPDALVNCEKEARALSVFIFDIDNFKNYNDTNGHPAGDDLLRRVAKLIKGHLREGDIACRYGGEEFLIAMPETDKETAWRQAEALRSKVASADLPHREKQPLSCVSVSGGVTAYPHDGTSVAELIQHADEALYHSKRTGRNRITRYQGVEIGAGSEEADRAAESPAPAS